MFDAVVGFILLGLGLKKTIPPTVLGEQDETEQSSEQTEDEKERQVALNSSDGLRVMKPKFTSEQQEAFQKDRAKREENLKKVGDERAKKLEESFAKIAEERKEKDKVTRDTLVAKIKEFKNAEKKIKLLSLSEKYQKTVTTALSTMQKKLQTMLSLLDKITAATGALKAQGTDVSLVEADVSTAQTKVSTAMYQVSELVDTLPTAFSISTEEAVKADVEKAIEESKSKIAGVKTAFKEAHNAVEKAVSDLEALTDAKEIGTWPEKK